MIRGRALPDHGMKFPWHEQLAARRFKTFLIETRFALSSFHGKKKEGKEEEEKSTAEKLRKVKKKLKSNTLLLLFHSVNCENSLVAIFLREWRGNRIINQRIHGKHEKNERTVDERGKKWRGRERISIVNFVKHRRANGQKVVKKWLVNEGGLGRARIHRWCATCRVNFIGFTRGPRGGCTGGKIRSSGSPRWIPFLRGYAQGKDARSTFPSLEKIGRIRAFTIVPCETAGSTTFR